MTARRSGSGDQVVSVPEAARVESGASLSPLSDDDVYLFNEGTHSHLFEKLGAHPVDGGTHFSVWAPNARHVSVVADWNGWDPRADPLSPRGSSGIWEGLIREAEQGALYKFQIVSRDGRHRLDKLDPFASYCEIAPQTAGVVWDSGT